eukprot:758500-Hanusia_phi.AAC.1
MEDFPAPVLPQKPLQGVRRRRRRKDCKSASVGEEKDQIQGEWRRRKKREGKEKGGRRQEGKLRGLEEEGEEEEGE